MNNTAQNHLSGNPQVKSTVKLGLDVDLQQITATTQYDHQTPKPAQSFTVARLVEWIKTQVQSHGKSITKPGASKPGACQVTGFSVARFFQFFRKETRFERGIAHCVPARISSGAWPPGATANAPQVLVIAGILL